MTDYAYTRHSLNKQKNSRAVQEDSLNNFVSAHAASNGFDLSGTFEWDGKVHSAWFHDVESGGTRLIARKEGGILCRILKPGDRVLVTKLDRLFRNCLDMETYVDKWVRNMGVSFYLVDQGGLAVDVRTKEGRMVLRAFAAVAELEREMIAERTSKAMLNKKRNGHRVTVYPGPGFKFQKMGDVEIKVPNFEELKVMAEMYAWYMGRGVEKPVSVEDIRAHITNNLNIRRKFLVKGKEVEKEWTIGTIREALKVQAAIEQAPGAEEALLQVHPELKEAIESARMAS